MVVPSRARLALRFVSQCVIAATCLVPRIVLAQATSDEVEITIEAEPSAPEGAAPESGTPTAAEPTPAAVAPVTEPAATEPAATEPAPAATEAAAPASATLSAAETVAEAPASVDESQDTDQDTDLSGTLDRLGLKLSGWIQVQYGQSQLSQDELLQGGQVLNQDRFVVRRGRIRLRGQWDQVRFDLELDGSTTRGPSTSVRRAALSWFHPSSDATLPPLVELTAGLTEIPLGIELQQGQDEIMFLERTTGSLALFPGPVDVGLKAHGALGPFRYALFITGGTPLDDRAGGPSAIDPTSTPDVILRLGAETDRDADVQVAGGVSALIGEGFHPGSPATKDGFEWVDSNGNGVIDISAAELRPVLGRAATPSDTFSRWAFAADVQAGLKTDLGWSRVYAEATIANNLDRGLFVADPITAGRDVRHLSWYVALVQELTQWSAVGVRFDVYDPDADFTASQKGRSVPVDASINTLSPFVAARLRNIGRLVFQYDAIWDRLGRDGRGVPVDVANNQWTLRLQGGF